MIPTSSGDQVGGARERGDDRNLPPALQRHGQEQEQAADRGGHHSRMTEEFAISRVLIGIREEPKSDQKMAPCYGDLVSRWRLRICTKFVCPFFLTQKMTIPFEYSSQIRLDVRALRPTQNWHRTMGFLSESVFE